MMCYQDRTFCITPGCVCGNALTDDIRAAAVKWWGSEDAPIAVARRCEGDAIARSLEREDKFYRETTISERNEGDEP